MCRKNASRQKYVQTNNNTNNMVTQSFEEITIIFTAYVPEMMYLGGKDPVSTGGTIFKDGML